LDEKVKLQMKNNSRKNLKQLFNKRAQKITYKKGLAKVKPFLMWYKQLK